MRLLLSLAGATLAVAGAIEKRQTLFQTTGIPTAFQGPTPTGQQPFLAATNPAPFPSVSFIPLSPLETQVPIVGSPSAGSAIYNGDTNIFHFHGQLSHYFPGPGFGIDEYPLPTRANITTLNMLSRHGARYPTNDIAIGRKIVSDVNNGSRFSGNLSFLNSWSYKLGQNTLTPVGKSELFDSGVLHQYLYGHLYNNNGSKIVVRSTTDYRMTQSAEYFLAGFFDQAWTRNASLELQIEDVVGYNTSLAAYFECTNTGATVGMSTWISTFLVDATARLNAQAPTASYFTPATAYNLMSLCAYETVALGYSSFCNLFTFQEWEGYEYAVDINFAEDFGFQSPVGRALGIAYVEEVLARMTNHYLTVATGSANITLDNNAASFPLNQSLFFDFSHDVQIMSILTAFGLKQFQPFFPDNFMIPHELVVSHLEPFGARLDIETIVTPQPLNPKRNVPSNMTYLPGGQTMYVHFVVNQRSLPLGYSLPACGMRDDGWCEMGAFLNATANAAALAQYDYSCFGNWSPFAYGALNNGAPPTSNHNSTIMRRTNTINKPQPKYRKLEKYVRDI